VWLYAPTIALPYYRITYRTGGKRLQRTYTCFEKADREARAIADKLALGEVSVAQINSSEVVQLRAAQEYLAPLGIRVDAAAGEYAALTSKLGTVSLDRAVDFYLLNNNPKLNEFRLVHLVEQFLDFKKASGVSDAYMRDLRNRTRTLKDFHSGSVSDLTPELMVRYFGDLQFAEHNHNNQLRVIRTLLRFAQSQGYLSDTVDLLRGVASKRVRKGSCPIYQPQEFAALLDSSNEEMMPALVLLGFCGVRPNEMRGLNWHDVRVESRTLVIDAANAKTASRRTVPLCEAALNRLRVCKASEGLIWGSKSDYWSKALNRLHRKAGVKQLPNGLRHSYISYRLTLTGDVNGQHWRQATARPSFTAITTRWSMTRD
jgi:integrase